MRKHAIAVLGFLAGVMVYYNNTPQEKTQTADEFHTENLQEVKVIQAAAVAMKSPASIVQVKTERFDPGSEETESFPGLPRGMKLAPNVRAVPEEQYTDGKVLMRKNGFVFIRSQGAEANVVYDQRLNTFHPITATIKLTGIDETKRDEILREWTEFHYNKELGIQYVQSTHDQLFDDYKKLKNNGYKVDLEIIQAVYRAR
jgi:hypothetical protein